MNRQSFQEGFVSDEKKSKRGSYFEIRYRIPQPNGKWLHKSERLYGVAGKKAARQVLRERLEEAAAQGSPLESGLTLRQFSDSYWKPHVDRRGLKLSTMASYRTVLNKHILPELGDLTPEEITALRISDLTKKKNEAGLSPRTIRNILVVLQSMFTLAEDLDVVDRSPVRKTHKPKAIGAEKRVWTSDQVRQIIEGVSAEHRCIFTLLALTGLRIGEVVALQWTHVDLHSRTIKVAQSLWNGKLVPPKTKSSVRTIQLADVLTQALVEHLDRASRVGANDFVFSRSDGSPLNPDVVRRDTLYPVLDRLQISRPKRTAGFHAFRHAAATIINRQTGNLKLAQKLLGHSEISTTADTYTHVSTESEKEASAALEKAIFGESVREFVRGHEQEQTVSVMGAEGLGQNLNEKGHLQPVA
jgi:integrase